MTNSIENYLADIYPKLIRSHREDRIFFQGQMITSSNNRIREVIPIYARTYSRRNDGGFYLLGVNTSPFDLSSPLVLVDIPDIYLKLDDVEIPSVQQYKQIIQGHEPVRLLRRAYSSNVAFPFISSIYGQDMGISLFDFPFVNEWKIEGVIRTDISPSLLLDSHYMSIYRIPFNRDNLFLFSIVLKDDIWQVYQLIASYNYFDNKRKFHNIEFLRIDSGCEVGQVYNDQMCDCRSQLNRAIDAITGSRNGIIIHIPTQDGRGYGTSPKSETELYKLGISRLKDPNGKLDTIQAAKLLYGQNEFDIRTYDGIARILKLLGISNIHLQTDNKRKVSALKSHGIRIERLPTGTHQDSCEVHIRAKHAYKDIYY